MCITENNRYSFEEYIERLKKTKRNNPQERNFQEIISDFLNKIFINEDIQVIDVSANRNTLIHNRDNYTGNKGTPDLLLARGYQYKNILNKEKECEYIAVIEIKAPEENTNRSKLIKKHQEQLESHLSKNEKLIFTDCLTWSFFKNDVLDKKQDIIPIKSFNLKDDSNEWKTDNIKTDEVIIDMLNNEYQVTESKDWEEIQSYIREFVLGN